MLIKISTRTLIIFVRCLYLQVVPEHDIMCTIHISSLIISTMDSNSQRNDENDSPLVLGRNLISNLSLSPPSPPRKRNRTTLEGLHTTTTKSSELPYLLSLDQCHLPGSSAIPSFTLKRRRIVHSAFQDDIDYSSYPRTTRKLQKEGLSFAGLRFSQPEHFALFVDPHAFALHRQRSIRRFRP